MHPRSDSSSLCLVAIFVVTSLLAGCLPSRATIPSRTWRVEAPEAVCAPTDVADPSSASWSPSGRAALEAKLARQEIAVVSVLGCKVEVLDRCQYKTTPDERPEAPLAMNLEGECQGATHLVREHESPMHVSPGDPVHLSRLTLGAFDLTGTWHGVMRQPRGPYEVYDATMELVQEGERVSGITRLKTIDGEYWGDLRFEGRLKGNTILFADAEVIDDNLGLFLAWCLKTGYVLVDPREERFRGPWFASFCASGSLDMHYVGKNHHQLAETTPR